jgi:hypothetical protein
MDTNEQQSKDAGATDRAASDLRRNAQDVVGRLAMRGIDVSSDEHPDNLVRLLDAVEAFEAQVQRKGGDLMVDEPVGGKPVQQPDNAAFQLPSKRDDESIGDFTERVRRAANVARDLAE